MSAFRIFILVLTFPLLCFAQKTDQELYRDHIQPLFEKRCIACHSCFNAPCQLNLQDATGFLRGANKANVYHGTRTESVSPTRLWIDATTTAEWRSKGFFDVASSKDPEQNIFWRMIQLRNDNPNLKIKKQVADSEICPSSMEQFVATAKSNPEIGMPYGLPALQSKEQELIKSWIQKGMPTADANLAITPPVKKQIQEWQEFFNDESLKQKLLSRYIYEHLFLAHIYFPDQPKDFFRLVRSETKCKKGIKEIATRRPNDDPGKKEFYYCLSPFNAAVAYKTHLPYEFSPQKMDRYKKIFFSREWTVTELPSYKTDVAENPFVAFQSIPAKSRYEFLLEDAQYQVATFIKGPVCNGSQAVNSIQEQFFTFFLNPDSDLMLSSPEYEKQAAQMLILPGMWGSDIKLSEAPILLKKITESREKYRLFRANTLTKFRPQGYKLQDIWDGNGDNPNAALTIFRHDDNAVVRKGAVGDLSKTVFVLDYALFERLVYNLVVNFDVFGNISHQFLTRVYMDQIRMEAEELFLTFLPPEQRLEYRRDWYKGFLTRAKMDYVFPAVGSAEPTGIRFNSETRTKTQFITKVLFFRMNEKVRGSLDSLNWKKLEVPDSIQPQLTINPTEKTLRTIASVQAGKKTPFARHFNPDLALLIIDSADQSQKIYSIIHNKEHENISWILGESLRMLPEQDSLTIREGIWGSYPNMIFRVKEAALSAFVKKLGAMKSPEDYRKLVQVYGVSRTDPNFWAAYDDAQKLFSQGPASEYGYLDLTRYALE